MQYLFGVLALVPVVLLVVGKVRGNVEVRSCCAVDAEHDGRISGALADQTRAAAESVDRLA
jgi:hypothetical protein